MSGSARVAFTSKANGARLEGEFIADTGVSWLVKPDGKYPVATLSKDEWDSEAPAAGHPFNSAGENPFDFLGNYYQ